MNFQSISIKKFREEVEAIDNDDIRNLVKIGYLTAARASELCTKTIPWEMLHGSTRPYGNFMTFKIMDYELTPAEDPSLKEKIQERAFVIQSAVAKRGKRRKRAENTENTANEGITGEEIEEALTRYNQLDLLKQWKAGEVTIDPLVIKALLGKIVFKAIAIPINVDYEPWVYDLLKFCRDRKKLSFDMTRQTFRNYYRAGLAKILPPKSVHSLKNPLRHWRLSHLLEYYNFDAVQLSNYSGWTMQTAFAIQGMKASSNIDFYIHLMWKQYFRKLLRPISQFT